MFNQPAKAFADMTRDEKIMAWEAARKTLEAAKSAEMEMRKAIVAEVFDAEQPGTQNAELGNGWKLKAVVKVNYNVDKDADKVDAVLDKLEDWQADRLIKWSPTLSVTEYKNLSDADRAVVDTIVTTSFASPTLELVPPKGA